MKLTADDLPHTADYAALRRAAYPDLTELADAVVKGDAEQMQGYIDACQAVKARFPKPAKV
jgi:hypothetical protein